MTQENLKLAITPCRVKDRQALPLEAEQAAIWWLGQAGFAVRAGSHTFLIDPYLSDFLAQKYEGQQFPHKRMMPIPVNPAALNDIDWVFGTHRHSDHLDPITIRSLARSSECRFFIPCAVLNQAVTTIGLDIKKTTCVNAWQPLTLDADISLYPIPAAHEEFRVNSRGEHHYLGYLFRIGGLHIFHSGDCVPFKT